MRILYVLLLLLLGAGLWLAIIFVPPWNPRAVIYVIGMLVCIIGFVVIGEIQYRQINPDIDKMLSNIDIEERIEEGRSIEGLIYHPEIKTYVDDEDIRSVVTSSFRKESGARS